MSTTHRTIEFDTEEMWKILVGMFRKHFINDEDCWYSCLKSGESCNEDKSNKCTCGADLHNDKVVVLARLLGFKILVHEEPLKDNPDITYRVYIRDSGGESNNSVDDGVSKGVS